MQLDDRLRHLGLPDVDVDDGAALALTRRRVERRRRRRVVAATVAVVLLIGMAASAVVIATARDRESRVATIGPRTRYLPSVLPADLKLAFVDVAPADVAGSVVEEGPGVVRIGFTTSPSQPRWLDLEVFPDQQLDIEEAATSWPGASRAQLGDGRPAILRREDSLAWNFDGAVLRLDGHGVSVDEFITVATSVTVVDERTWRERTAGADVGPPYGFLEPPQLVAEGPGWRVLVGLHRQWLNARGERLLFEGNVGGGGMMLGTQHDSPLLSVEHARSGPNVIAYGVGPRGTATFRLTYGDEIVEVDAFVSPSGASVFAVDVGAVDTEPTEIAAFDAQGVQLTGLIQPPTPLVFDP